jgi:hypothetical protein
MARRRLAFALEKLGSLLLLLAPTGIAAQTPDTEKPVPILSGSSKLKQLHVLKIDLDNKL